MGASPLHDCRFSPIVTLDTGRLHAIAIDDAEPSCALHAIATVAEWRRDHAAARDVAIAIDAGGNLTPGDLAAELARHGVAAEALMLRVPRYAVGAHPELDALVELGVSIAVVELDLHGADAGLLAGAPIDLVELPRAEVAVIDSDAGLELRRAIAVAHRHDWMTVAHGVARRAQADALARLGCDLVAGPLIGERLDAAALHAWLAGKSSALAG